MYLGITDVSHERCTTRSSLYDVTEVISSCPNSLLGEWLNFKLFRVTYLVGKRKFKLLFQGPLAK